MSSRMTNTEAVMLCRFAKACCPQQQVDEFTPDAWWELLNDLTFDACKGALVEVVKRQPFVAPAEIRAEVKRVRGERMRRHEALIGENWPGEWSDHAAMVWNREVRRLIADGDVAAAADIPAWSEDEVLALDDPHALTARAVVRASRPTPDDEQEES